MTNTIKVGQLPGKIIEVAVEENATVANVLEIAGLDATGFEIKVDGNTVTENDVVGSANMVLLTKKVKGNTNMNTVKVGQLPGKIEEYTFEAGTTVAQALEIAGLSVEGFEIKVDGNVADLSTTIEGANMILLAKKVKGNAGTVKIGQLPGKIEEYTFEAGTNVAQALEVAGLSADGFEIKVDGNVADLNTPIDGASMVLLAKKVKGNK